MAPKPAYWPTDLQSAIDDDKEAYEGRYKSWTNKIVYDRLSALEKERHVEKRRRDYWAKRVNGGRAALCFYSLSGRPRAKVCTDIVRIRKAEGLPNDWIGTYEEAVEVAEVHRFVPHKPDENEDVNVEEAEDDMLDSDDEDSSEHIETSKKHTITTDNNRGVNPVDLLLKPAVPAPADDAQEVNPTGLLREATYPTPAHSLSNHQTAKRARTQAAESQIHETITPSFAIDGFVAKGQVDYHMTDTALHVKASDGIEIKTMRMADRVQVFLNDHQILGKGVSPAFVPVSDQRTRKRKHRDDEKKNDKDEEVAVAAGAYDDTFTFVNVDG